MIANSIPAGNSAAIFCRRCGSCGPHQHGPGRGPHAARLVCGQCGQFIAWLSCYSPEEREARRQQARLQAMAQRPPSASQLAYLSALGDDGPPPQTMAEASERIYTLKRGRVA